MSNSPERASAWQRSSFARFCRWLGTWAVIKRLLIVSAWVATLIALFYAIENWRGARAWTNYRRGLPEQGVELEFKSYVPNPVPEGENFASVPCIKEWFAKGTINDGNGRWSDPYSRAHGLVPGGRPKNQPARRKFVDLVAWKAAFTAVREGRTSQDVEAGPLDAASRAAAAPAVLEGLRTNSGLFAELRAASSRPFAAYPINYDEEVPWLIRLPHLANVKSASVRLQLRACAELALGQSDKALEDVELGLRLADSLKEEPILVSQLVRAASFHCATPPVWEGLVEHRWSPAQLQILRKKFGQFGFLKEMQRAMEGERATVLQTFEYVRKHGRVTTLFGPQDGVPRGDVAEIFARLMPSGWYHKELLNYSLAFDRTLRGTYDVQAHRVFPSRLRMNEEEVHRALGIGTRGPFSMLLHHQVAISVFTPAWPKVVQKFSAAQITADQVAVACALEEYRLAHGEYPEQLLPALSSGDSLPADLFTGEPFHYRRTPKGGYILYSVGWDEKDDGGVPGKTLHTEETGDWVLECTPSGAS